MTRPAGVDQPPPQQEPRGVDEIAAMVTRLRRHHSEMSDTSRTECDRLLSRARYEECREMLALFRQALGG